MPKGPRADAETLPGFIDAAMTDANPPCPRCGAKAVRIVYGLPGPSEEYDRGEIHLGGCIVSEDMSAWHCNACGHEFGKAS